MNPIFAVLIMLALFLCAVALILLAQARRQLASGLALTGIGTFAALGIAHTGGLHTADPAWFRQSGSGSDSQVETIAGRCAEMVRLLRDNRVYRDVDDTGIVVNNALWQQIPAPARTISGDCIARAKGIEPSQLVITNQALDQ